MFVYVTKRQGEEDLVFGPGNGSPMATNIVLLLGAAVIRFAIC